MKRYVEIYPDIQTLNRRAFLLTSEILARKKSGRIKSFLALSGGSTPESLYEMMGKASSGIFDWSRIHIFWSDERCVPPENPNSNYRMACEKLIEPASIPPENIHRIRGEDYPETEADRYACEIFSATRTSAGSTPSFNLILLGMGADGHTASIFPGFNPAGSNRRLVEPAIRPDNGSERITLTLRTINNAKNVIFLITGEEKAKTAAGILKGQEGFSRLPAAHIAPLKGRVFWLLDKAAAKYLKS